LCHNPSHNLYKLFYTKTHKNTSANMRLPMGTLLAHGKIDLLPPFADIYR
jgi:hypothetical protein